MKQKFDIENWPRKEHFEFFSQFEEPFFGLVTKVDCTKAYAKCKENGFSFFLYYLHKALVAANHIENFKYKIEDGEIFVYDQIDATPTVGRNDGTFGFSYLQFDEDFEKFSREASKILEIIKNGTGLFPPIDLPVYENVIEFSSIPWVDFTSLSHARSYRYKSSNPKVSFGKLTENEGVLSMSVSLHVHHGLMDGYHTGLFFQYFQEEMNR